MAWSAHRAYMVMKTVDEMVAEAEVTAEKATRDYVPSKETLVVEQVNRAFKGVPTLAQILARLK